MKKIISVFFLIIFYLFISGCNPVSIKDFSSNNSNIRNLEQQLSQNKDDPHIIGQLADAYYQQYVDNGDDNSLNKAIENYDLYLNYAPDHNVAMVTLYALLLEKQAKNRRYDPKIYARLSRLYQDSEVIRKSDLASPTLAKALWKIDRATSEDELPEIISILQKAIKENPEKTSPYIVLSNIQLHMGHDRIAIATLRQAVSVSPDDYNANVLLGDMILEKIQKNECIVSDQNALDEAINSFKKAISSKPDDVASHDSLSTLFFYQGSTSLRLHEAKILHELQNSDDSKITLANAFYDNYQTDKAEKLYLELLNKSPDDIYTLGELAQLYSTTGQWQNAKNIWDKFFKKNKSPTFYNYLISSLVLGHLEGNNIKRKFIENNTLTLELSGWEKSLKQYQLDQIDAQTLLNMAKTKCEKTEAEFYIAYNYWLNNDLLKAKAHFKNVMDLKVYPYKEYINAKYALRILEEI